MRVLDRITEEEMIEVFSAGASVATTDPLTRGWWRGRHDLQSALQTASLYRRCVGINLGGAVEARLN